MRYQVVVRKDWPFKEVYPSLERVLESFPWAEEDLRAGRQAVQRVGSPGGGGYWRTIVIQALRDDEPGEFYYPAPPGACISHSRRGVVPPGEASIS